MRVLIASMLALLVTAAGLPIAALAQSSAPRLAIMEPEITGDLSDPAQRPEWPRRLDMIDDQLREGVATLYEVADRRPAEDLMASYRKRAGVFDCKPCIAEVAGRLHADRVLSVKVHRMSQLVMNLHAVLRDADTGAVRYARTLSFRSDNDRSWRRAADYLLRDMAQIPTDRL